MYYQGSYSYSNPCCCGYGGIPSYGSGGCGCIAIVLVLFILLVIVLGARFV